MFFQGIAFILNRLFIYLKVDVDVLSSMQDNRFLRKLKGIVLRIKASKTRYHEIRLTSLQNLKFNYRLKTDRLLLMKIISVGQLYVIMWFLDRF